MVFACADNKMEPLDNQKTAVLLIYSKKIAQELHETETSKQQLAPKLRYSLNSDNVTTPYIVVHSNNRQVALDSD